MRIADCLMCMMRIFAICLFAVSGEAVAQEDRDSLLAVWSDAQRPDTQRLRAIQDLVPPMWRVDIDSAFLLTNQQLALARRIKSDYWIARALFNVGQGYYYKREYAAAADHYRQSLPYRERLNDNKGIGSVYGSLGMICNDQHRYVEGLRYMQKSLEYYGKTDERSDDASVYANLVVLYRAMSDSAKVLEYAQKALEIYDPITEDIQIARLYNNLGALYKDFGDYPQSLNYYQRSLEIRRKRDDWRGAGIVLLNLGVVRNILGDYAMARAETREAIDLFRMVGDSATLANCYASLGDIANNEGNHREAISMCTRAYARAAEGGDLHIQWVSCECLYLAYKGLGQAARALHFQEEWVALRDSLKTDDVRLVVNRMDFQRQLSADSLARVEERTRMELTHAQRLNRKNQVLRFILNAGAVVLLLALLFLGGMLFFLRRTERLKSKTRALENQQLINSISLLRTQVNPHFLFNSLSILSSLVRVDPTMSERFIDQLARSYRYILEQSEEQLVTLRTELNFIDSYAFLLRMRFADKFDLDIRIPEDMLDSAMVAPLTLQLLIENAVKHNRMSVKEPLIVHVGIDGEGMLEVSNNLQPRSTASSSTGMGLRNIRDRYQLLTRQPVMTGESGGRFVVRIPLVSLDGEAA
jgi:tetratricopeptide (TPR) repeat protein